jgi:DNA-binding XRE family transcriptional regulator
MTLEAGQKVPMAPGRQAVAEALDQLEAVAHSAARSPEPALRVAGNAARLVLDLCRDDYAVVAVTPAGWEVVKPSPLALRRGQGMQPLPEPVEFGGAALDELRSRLGFDGADHDAFWALYVGFMFAALRPAPPYFVLAVAGEQGTGKTTTVKLLRLAVDPHDTDTQPKPRSEDDLFVNADGQWLTIYDNLSALNQHYSDAFCRISTGSGYSKRKLYSDRETARFQVARPQIITAIVDVVAAPDLLDRSLLAAMPELDGYRAEEELLEAAAALMPRVLGQLLDAAAVALRDQKAVRLSTVPRMVGPTRWIEAGARVLGLEPGQFLAAYLDSQARAGEMALEASLIGAPLRDMLGHRDGLARLATKAQPYRGPIGFEGTSKKLLAELTDFMSGKPRGQGWPNTPRGMSGALRRIAPALRKLGYAVDFLTVGHAKDRIIVIDTPNASAVRSAHDATNPPHRPHRPQCNDGDIYADGAGGADGRMLTQTNGGHKEERDVGVSFMITAAQRTALRARGFSDDQIRTMRPAEAHAILVEAAERADQPAQRAPTKKTAAYSDFQSGTNPPDVPAGKCEKTKETEACAGVPVQNGVLGAQRENGAAKAPADMASMLANLAAARMAVRRPSTSARASEGQRIRAAREARGWSQKALANAAGTHQPSISALERDQPVNATVRARVLSALGL